MFAITSILRRSLMAPAAAVRSSLVMNTPRITAPTLTSASALVNPIRTFKVRTSVKKLCKDCYIVRRKGRVYVYCKSDHKHKQRQG